MASVDEDTSPKFGSLTDVDPASPFDSTDQNVAPVASGGGKTQLSEDPPTSVVRAGSFRELPPGTVVDDVYEIDARLGAGAMGEVYAARHIRLGKRVAIKVIGKRLSEDDAAIERFAMEARTLAQIQHPAIVAIDHVGELADGRAYFVMELLRGESLFDRLQRGKIPLPEALRIFDQMARGLEAAHAEGVTHRDLKPENTFLANLPGEPPAVKLLDFGLAKLAAERSDLDRRAERTQSGVAIGTPMYMSPEQARGPDVDHRTDVYALGCVAYELLLGQPPFPHAKTAPELYAAHLHESPPLPRSIWPEIPPQLDLALFAMLTKDPAHRPTLAQVRAVIADVRTTPSQRAQTEFVGPRAGKPQTRARAAIAAIAILVGGITIGATVVHRSRDQSSSRLAPLPAMPAMPAADERATTPVAAPDAAPPSATSPPAPKKAATPPSPRATSGGRHGTPRQTPRAGSAAVVVAAPADAGIDAEDLPPPVQVEKASPPPPPSEKTVPKTKPPVDRNQTIDPFKHKVKP